MAQKLNELQALINKLPKSKLKDALNTLGAALIEFDRVTVAADVDDASDVLEEAGLAADKLLKPYGFVIVPVARQLPQGPSFISNYLPRKKTAAIATLRIAGLAAYRSGLVDKAIETVKGFDFAGFSPL